MNIREILSLVPVVPVLTVSEAAHAVPLAQALYAGGLRVLEITLRTLVGISAIEAVRKAVPGAVVGAGNLTKAAEFAAAGRAGTHARNCRCRPRRPIPAAAGCDDTIGIDCGSSCGIRCLDALSG
jgi:hypothetical protein